MKTKGRGPTSRKGPASQAATRPGAPEPPELVLARELGRLIGKQWAQKEGRPAEVAEPPSAPPRPGER